MSSPLRPKNIKRLLWYSVIKHSFIRITDFSFDIESDPLMSWLEASFPHCSASLSPLCTNWTKSWSSPRKLTNAPPSSEHLTSLRAVSTFDCPYYSPNTKPRFIPHRELASIAIPVIQVLMPCGSLSNVGIFPNRQIAALRSFCHYRIR